MSIDYEFLTSVVDVNDEVWFEIQNRTITPLNKEGIIDALVQNDANSRNFGFYIQRYFEDEDLSTKRIRIHYVNSLNQHDMVSAHSINVVGDEQDVVSFKWLISKKVCLESGNMKFAIEFYNDDESYQLFTKTTYVNIVEGLDDYIQIEEPESDWLNEYSTRMNKLESYVKGFEDAVNNGEFDDAYAINTFANTIKETKVGSTVVCNGVSPIQHTVKVKITGVANPTSVKVTRYGATATDNAIIYTPNADGTVSGITSLSPTMTIITDNADAIIECEYNKDTNTVVNEVKTNIDTNARSKACAVICEHDGTTVVLNDSSNDKFQELKICGKSTQNGTPTPDAPVDIVSIGGTIDLGVFSKNLFDAKMLELKTNTSLSILDNGYTIVATGGTNGGYTRSTYKLPQYIAGKTLYFKIDSVTKTQEVDISVQINVITPSRTYYYPLREANQSIEVIIPSDTTYATIGIYTNTYSEALTTDNVVTVKGIMLSVIPSDTDNWSQFIPIQDVSLVLSDLKGIPVTDPMFATYTDENGQMWCADEIDLVRGVYVQRVAKQALNGTETWTGNRGMFQYKPKDYKNLSLCGLCTHYNISRHTQGKGVYFGIQITFIVDEQLTTDEWATRLAELNMAGTPVVVQYILNSPIETPLTTEQIELCKSLHTNYPNTTIINNQNAHMLVKYNADTKLYIDNAIATALAQFYNQQEVEYVLD